jgi:hypothetical protein
MRDAGIFPEAKLREIVQEAKELVAIFVALRPNRNRFYFFNLISDF